MTDWADSTADLYKVRDMMAGSPGVTRAEWTAPGAWRRGRDAEDHAS